MAKTKPAGDREPTAAPDRSYDIIGLEQSDWMPIKFDGRDYDLANLTEAEADYLLGFPQQVPYLKKKLDVSQASI